MSQINNIYYNINQDLRELRELKNLSSLDSSWFHYRQEIAHHLIAICYDMGAIIEKKYNLNIKLAIKLFQEIKNVGLKIKFSSLEKQKFQAILNYPLRYNEYYLFIYPKKCSLRQFFRSLFYKLPLHQKYDLYVYFNNPNNEYPEYYIRSIVPWLDVDILNLNYLIEQINNHLTIKNKNQQQQLQVINDVLSPFIS